MSRPPTDPRRRQVPEHATWSDVLASYLLAATIPLALWILGRPLVRAAAVAAVAGLLGVAHRASRLAWCLHVCRELTVDLAGAVRITITRVPTDDRR